MGLYEQYIKRKFDLSAFGIERGESRSTYFCTPKGARIIGWTGVDGIHYCTVKAFGEKVFAVDPMGTPGKHAFPVAESFEDFLRLLMACGHEAHIEQAHAWSRERYDEFVKDNPITAKANEHIIYLQNEYGLTSIDDPYQYLKNIYDSFDYSIIPYKDDYYEYVPRDEMPLSKEWKVFFSHGRKKGRERAGDELTLDKRFSWGSYELYVPSAYICAKGLVLDIFAEADTEKVHAFLDKWAWTNDDESMITHEQREQIMEENPLNMNFKASVIVNGKRLFQKQSSGNGWVNGYTMYQSNSMKDVLEHYGIDMEKCWIYRRISFPWATNTKPQIRHMKIQMEQKPAVIHGIHFRVSGVGQRIKFTHPITNTEHTLTVIAYEQDEMILPGRNHAAMLDGYELPTHHTRMAYTLTPELSGNTFHITSTGKSDPPRKLQIKNGSHCDFVGAASIGIIGGADGPTALIFADNVREKKQYAASSHLTFEPQTDVEWKITFREKTVEDGEFTLI